MHQATNLRPRLFADDTNIFSFGSDLQLLTETTNAELSKIDCWLKSNKLMLSIEKTNYCVFSPKRNVDCSKIQIQIGGDISRTTSIKYLGLTIDENFSWTPHIKDLGSRIVSHASLFSKLRHLLPKECLLALYHAFVQSKIDYGLEIWGDAAAKDLTTLQTYQNRILKILQFKDFTYPTNALHREAGLLKICDQYELENLQIMHQLVYRPETLPESIRNICQLSGLTRTRNLRDKLLFNRTKSSSKWGDRAFSNKGPLLWNRLPLSAKTIDNQNSFKKTLKEAKLQEYSS